MRVALLRVGRRRAHAAPQDGGRRLVPREEEHRAGHAERQRDAEGHVRDERVRVAVVRRRVVGFLSKLLLSLSAMTPNAVPTPAATIASPPVT